MIQRHIPRIMMAAAASGSGKTILTCGLLQALKDRGLEPVSYKCGPDYIDPMFHSRILDISARNLDTYFMTDDRIIHTLTRAGSHPVIIEGVMGIYDGLKPDTRMGSSYETAHISNTPIILTVDARGVGRTIISIIKGILADDTAHLIKGLILNRISEGFYRKLEPVLRDELAASGYGGVMLLGAVPVNSALTLESRYLGLKLPGEIEDLKDKISQAARIIEGSVDIDAVLKIMDAAAELNVRDDERNISIANDEPLVMAVAQDDAFCFYYQDNLDMFRDAGVKTVPFSPLADKRLPEGASALMLGGGYPERYLKELSDNTSMLESVRAAIRSGMPSIAECGGYMYLHKFISDETGARYPMADVIDAECRYTGHLVRFGYLYIRPDDDGTVDHAVGMKGHEFHYYDSTYKGGVCTVSKPSGEDIRKCLISDGVSLWGFPHFYYPSKPDFVYSFIGHMKEFYRGAGR